MQEIGPRHSEAMNMYCDNQATIFIANNPAFYERTKHIEVDYHFIKEAIENKTISMPYLKLDDQHANIFI